MKNSKATWAPLAAILVLILLSNSGNAAADVSCLQSQDWVVYGNGILSTTDNADDSIGTIRMALYQELPYEEFYQIDFAKVHNPTNGFLADVFESALQDAQTDTTQIWRALSGLSPMPQFLQGIISEKLEEIASTPFLVWTDALQRQTDFYKAKILEGNRVLLVAHSQGTFYANQAYALLSPYEKSSFGIVSVAEMDSYVAGGYPYTTLIEDMVANLVRAAKLSLGLPGPPLPTVTNWGTPDLVLGHNFVLAYMEPGSNSRENILAQILSVLASLDRPTSPGFGGPITVTLSWGSQPDLDLHVFEPNSTHVYYANRSGLSGYLDTDDVNGYGPEHYYVACETLESGTYHVGVNYYHGYAPETARIQIQAGQIVRNYDVFLPEDYGSEGNSSPTPVADIFVSWDSASGYTYSVAGH